MISAGADRITREVLDRFETQVRSELKQLDAVFASLRTEAALEVFPLSEAMLKRATELASIDLPLRPFDQSILAGILVRAEELWEVGERDLSFCEVDADLQPWDKKGNAKQPLTELFDRARVWVYGDFELSSPERPPGWPN